MNRISPELKEWVNSKILEYLPRDRVVQGDKIVFRCPICGDSRKNSLKKRGYYYTRTASFHCFNCDANLSGMKFLEILSGEDYATLKQEYFRMTFDGKHFTSASGSGFSGKKPETGIFSLKNIVKPEWKRPLSGKAKEYLENRKVLSAPFLREELFSYERNETEEYILIPWKIDGIECYFQLNDFLKIGKRGLKYIFPKNTDKLVYGLDNIDISFPYVICFEGVYDSLFVKNGVAIGGKSLTATQEELIRKRFPRHTIAISFDNDKPGLEAMARSVASGGKFAYFKWFSDGEKAKDINDYVLETGNLNAFADPEKISGMVMDRLSMSLWLGKMGIIKEKRRFSNDKNQQVGSQRQVQPCPHGNFRPDPPGKVRRVV